MMLITPIMIVLVILNVIELSSQINDLFLLIIGVATLFFLGMMLAIEFSPMEQNSKNTTIDKE